MKKPTMQTLNEYIPPRNKRPTEGAKGRRAARAKALELIKTNGGSTNTLGLAKRSESNDPELTKDPISFNSKTLIPVLLSQPSHQLPAYEYLGELPESYGTKKLYLIARDPRWLYGYWDLSDAQYLEATQGAHDHKLFLELFRDGSSDRLQQIQIPRGTKGWYLWVQEPDTYYYARLGFYRQDGGFEQISRSGVAHTPRDKLSSNNQARFATIPFHQSFRELLQMIQSQMIDGEELADGLARLQMDGAQFPCGEMLVPQDLNRDSREEVLNGTAEDLIRHIRVGSMEITEVIRRRLEQMKSSSSGQWNSSWSSPMGASFAAGKSREFFMHVNAELIIYGGTDPKATLQINGQPIALSRDGNFSYHFNFPDGQYSMPIEAVSPDKVESRFALLSFQRFTGYLGEVEPTPQEPRQEPIGRVWQKPFGL